ncbi:MAG TPA: oxygen-dependent coproporphyrinogen oxidase [Puia sp.]|nr:oxygen-dependent coproporphyrinogen oxidase [Puia sp.]
MQPYKTETKAFRGRWIDYVYSLQDKICSGLEEVDGSAKFITDEWERPGGQGGGGRTRVIENGRVFEKGGVNTSVVFGKVTDPMRRQLHIEGSTWFACGLSLVIHPVNPYVPTVHANWRFFELYDEAGYLSDRWFGGGADLTPYYLFEEDAKHFHRTLKEVLDRFDDQLYPEHKKACDRYFSNTHRQNETRGIGGIFYDYIRPQHEDDAEKWMDFQQRNGNAFLDAYLPIVKKRKDIAYGEREIFWQEIRRGRYVEFNLIHDRGTVFGLKTNGRTESILMSLPPRARWVYDYHPEPGTAEAELLQVCLNPKEWV